MTQDVPKAAIGKILLVGASRGLGLGIAGEFAKRGWHVVGTVRAGARTELHDLEDAHTPTGSRSRPSTSPSRTRSPLCTIALPADRLTCCSSMPAPRT